MDISIYCLTPLTDLLKDANEQRFACEKFTVFQKCQFFLEYTKEIAKISFFINVGIKMKGGFIAC